MSDISDRDARQLDMQAEPDIIEMLPCTCIQHPFAALPPDLQPRQAPKVSGLRKYYRANPACVAECSEAILERISPALAG
jgi:hypothetical protein